MASHTLQTPSGPARAELHHAEQGAAALLLGHGAGGGLGAKDLVAVTHAVQAAGVHVVLVEQPYRVAGRRAPAPAKQLDEAWLSVAQQLADGPLVGLPQVFGGRSSGARVACRTAERGQAAAALCLAFPLHPVGKPEKSRQHELDDVPVPTLVVQGTRDPFGRPVASSHHEIELVDADHSLATDVPAVTRAVAEWIARVLRPLE